MSLAMVFLVLLAVVMATGLVVLGVVALRRRRREAARIRNSIVRRDTPPARRARERLAEADLAMRSLSADKPERRAA